MDIVEEVKVKLMKKFDLEESDALQLAKDAVFQIEAHGGNPKNEEQTDSVIDVVVRRWIEMRKEPVD